MNNPNLFVITGGPGTGKTTVLMELQRLGCRVIAEVARQIIQEQAKTGGNALPWKDKERYTELMLQRCVQSFVQNSPAESITFADRGIPDTLCYARLIGLKKEDGIRAACATYRYANVVLLAPFWPEIYANDAERKQDLEEAQRTSLLMEQVYRDCGYAIIELPKTSPASRAEFILQNLPSF